jgi:DUF4097 and DUF4098 domain-containing protein YvlB
MNIEVIEKEFIFEDGAVLSLSNIRGKVSIQAGDNGVIKVVAEKVLDSGDAENTRIELLQDGDGRVIVRTQYDQSGFRFFRRITPCKVNYEVVVPQNCDLKVRGVSNSADITGISGFLDISTVSGDLEVNSHEGKLTIKSVSGDVDGEKITGQAHIDAVSGDFHLRQSSISMLRYKTVSGDLFLQTSLGKGPYEFNSVSGDIRLEAIQLTGVTIDSSSLGGKLRSPLPQSSTIRSRNHHRVEILGGGVDIRHKSVSGDFFFDSPEEIEEFDRIPLPSPDRVEPQSHSEILEGISSGEITVDEAVGMLEADQVN